LLADGMVDLDVMRCTVSENMDSGVLVDNRSDTTPEIDITDNTVQNNGQLTYGGGVLVPGGNIEIMYNEVKFNHGYPIVVWGGSSLKIPISVSWGTPFQGTSGRV